MEIIQILSEWEDMSTVERKQVHHSRQEYRHCEKYVSLRGSGTNALQHHDTGLFVAIHEDMFDVICNAHVGMGHARTAQNILNELKNKWFRITQAGV